LLYLFPCGTIIASTDGKLLTLFAGYPDE